MTEVIEASTSTAGQSPRGDSLNNGHVSVLEEGEAANQMAKYKPEEERVLRSPVTFPGLTQHRGNGRNQIAKGGMEQQSEGRRDIFLRSEMERTRGIKW